eukprot:TRINITY_DN413_c0_g1_i1.p1 TRINITY_DN413_c0_g1~~TRINITY_DN413_c0_g1_i1.p1  ORF type:complete len:279 (+),score=17.76 TRINITY_DN413_c0_g1_i1:145-981(+)
MNVDVLRHAHRNGIMLFRHSLLRSGCRKAHISPLWWTIPSSRRSVGSLSSSVGRATPRTTTTTTTNEERSCIQRHTSFRNDSVSSMNNSDRSTVISYRYYGMQSRGWSSSASATPSFSSNVFVPKSSDVVGDVSIGDWSSVWYGSVVRGSHGRVSIGEYTNIQDNSVLASSLAKCALPMRVGSFCTIGHSCVLLGCELADNVHIGMASVLLPGCVLEPYTFLGAGTVVPEGTHIPEGELWMGNPAKFVRKLKPGEYDWIRSIAKTYARNGELHARDVA